MSSSSKGIRAAGGDAKSAGGGAKNPMELAKDLSNAIEKVFGHLGVKGYVRIEDIGNNRIKVESHTWDVNVRRIIKKNADGSLEVHHDLLEIDKAHQGKGLSKQFLRESIAAYEKAGVDKVDMLANLDVGGYAWARTGYSAKRPQAELITKSSAWAREIVNDFYKKNPETKPFPMNLLTENKSRAQKFLKGKNWFAEIDMHDKEQMKYIKSYLNGKSKK